MSNIGKSAATILCICAVVSVVLSVASVYHIIGWMASKGIMLSHPNIQFSLLVLSVILAEVLRAQGRFIPSMIFSLLSMAGAFTAFVFYAA